MQNSSNHADNNKGGLLASLAACAAVLVIGLFLGLAGAATTSVPDYVWDIAAAVVAMSGLVVAVVMWCVKRARREDASYEEYMPTGEGHPAAG
jgi:hypothetical protein